MIEPEAWQAFGGVAAVVILLGGVAMALRRLGFLGGGQAAADGAAPLRQIEKDLQALRLHIAEHYVRRDDWITTQSRVIGLLEAHSIALARLEERARGERNAP